jgi:hypothetical protein
MKWCVVYGVLGLMLLVLVPDAFSFTIDGTYWVSDNHGYGDNINANNRLDNNLFNIRGMDIAFSGGVMDVKVYTGFFEGASDSHGTLYGDLFISTDGWHPDGTLANHFSSNNAANGEFWEFVFDTSENQLYDGAFSIVLSLNAPPQNGGNGFIIRNGQEV